MLTHEDLVQGTQEWKAHRATHFNASDCPAMLNCSPYTTRTQLLHQLHTGMAPEVDAMTQRRFDEGHRIEALARPLAARIIGEDLYPVVGSKGEMSASFDGLTMDESTAFEHKTLNDKLRACMRDQGNGCDLPKQYRAQMEQQLMVCDGERVLFMASKWDGDNLVEELHCWYASDPALRAEILAGWQQFAKDLAAYVPQEVIVPAVAAPQIGLPSVSIQVTGSIALVDNLEKFGTALTAYIASLNRKPETDQDFANLEDAVKRLKNAEDQLDAAESSAIGQTGSIDAMRRTVALHRDTARSTRLLIDKLVKAEKENRRTKIVSDAVAELHTHMAGLNARTRNHMPAVANQFQEVIKGLKSIDSMRDKVAGELARCKIESNAIADRIQYHLELLDDEVEFGFLFPDHHQIVHKASDDFKALIASRIAAHKAAEAAKEAALVARIEAEAKEKAEREARAKVAAEQAASDKRARDQAAFEQLERDEKARLAKLNTTMIVEAAPVVLSDKADADRNANAFIDRIEQQMPVTVRQAIAPKPAKAPTLALGVISERLGVNVTSAFLATLGFEATVVKAARLFHEEDFPAICRALIEHIESVCELQPA
jgi:putative phage-type endonuclease